MKRSSSVDWNLGEKSTDCVHEVMFVAGTKIEARVATMALVECTTVQTGQCVCE